MQTYDHHEIYSMKLHDELTIYKSVKSNVISVTSVRRVPGGWIYSSFMGEGGIVSKLANAVMTSVFVPFNDQFQEIK